MLIRAVPWRDFAFLFFCITQLGPCVASSRLTFPVLCEALRFFPVAVPCHSLPFLGSALLIDSSAMLRFSLAFPIEANPPLLSSLPMQHISKPGPRFSFLCHCQSGQSNSNAMPSYSNAKLVNALAVLFISRANQSSADLCHRRARRFHAAALLLPTSLCPCASRLRFTYAFLGRSKPLPLTSGGCISSAIPSNSRAKPSPTDLLSAAAFRYKTNLCLNYAIDCFSSTVRCFAFPLLGYAEPLPCHFSPGHRKSNQRQRVSKFCHSGARILIAAP